MYKSTLDLKDYLKVDGKFVCVSTVGLGVEHYDNTWFETAVFPSDGKDITNYSEMYMKRYKTEQEAVDGHKTLVNLIASDEVKIVQEGSDDFIYDRLQMPKFKFKGANKNG